MALKKHFENRKCKSNILNVFTVTNLKHPSWLRRVHSKTIKKTYWPQTCPRMCPHILIYLVILLRFHPWAVGRIMWWMPCHSVSSTLKSRVLRSATPRGGYSSGRKSSRPGTTLPRTVWPLTSYTSKSCAGSNSESTAVIGSELLYAYFTLPNVS